MVTPIMVKCPTCGAEPGAPCRTDGRVSDVHIYRVYATAYALACGDALARAGDELTAERALADDLAAKAETARNVMAAWPDYFKAKFDLIAMLDESLARYREARERDA